MTKRIYECIISNKYNLIDEIKEYFNKDSDSNIESEINDSLKLLIELNLISKKIINRERYYFYHWSDYYLFFSHLYIFL